MQCTCHDPSLDHDGDSQKDTENFGNFISIVLALEETINFFRLSKVYVAK